MSCNEIGHPYMSSSGHHKYTGAGGQAADCASVTVTSNRASIEIQVSLPDDLERQNGETTFCRSYREVCPTGEVLFEAPATSPRGTPFNHWVKDGVDQPEGELIVALDPCDDRCHTLRAVYGGTIILQGECWDGLEVPEAATITAPAFYAQLPCQGGPNCPSDMNPYLPTACWNHLWEWWNAGVFEIDFRDEGPGGALWTTHTGWPIPSGFQSLENCSPAIPNDCVPGQDCWCPCESFGNCVSPIVECTIPAYCLGGCATPAHPTNWGFKFWTRAWQGTLQTWCSCDLHEVRLFWLAQVSKHICARGNVGDCCFNCDPPTPLCGCPCHLGGDLGRLGMTIDFGTPDTSDPPETWLSFSEPKTPGESCGEAMQRLWNRVMSNGGLFWERDVIVNTYPSGEEGSPRPMCQMRREESIQIEF